ncbi:MAG: MFS transporter [Phycisphaeraceae bacterium]|nr:MFS transporter [Phycisphaeraceae bacterium]
MPDSASAAQQPVKTTPLWRNPSFTLMWASVAASGFGDRMIMAAALILLGAMASETDSGRVSFNAATQFFFFLPYLFLSFPAGWLADKLPRKWILLTCDELRAAVLCGALFSVYSLSGDPVLTTDMHWKVFLVLFLVGSLAATFNPTRNATIPQIVAQKQLQAGNAFIIGLGVVASMIGAVAATRILDAERGESIKYGLMIAIGFYAVSGSFFAFLKPRDAERPEQSDRSLRQALRYLRGHMKHIRLMVVFTCVWGSAMIVYNAALTFGHLHFDFVGSELFTHYLYMTATIGGGMLIGAGVIAIIGTQREATLVLKISLIGVALCMIVFTLVPYRPLHFATGLFVGIFGNMCVINVLSLLQVISPNYMRGRIMGLTNIVSTIGTITINGIIWQLPDADSWMPPVVLTNAGILLVIGIAGLIYTLPRGPMPNKMANVFWRLTRLFCFSWHGMTVRNKQRIPARGPVVIVANHTTAMDPFLIQSSTIRMVRWLMLTSYRMKIGNALWNAIDPICIEHDLASDERGSAMRQIRQIVGELKRGHVVGMFPEGHLQYDSRELRDFEGGAAVVARLSGAQIVPCWVDGTVVSRSMLKHVLKPTTSTITFGQPFTPGKNDSPEDITAELRRRIIALGEEEAARRAGQT